MCKQRCGVVSLSLFHSSLSQAPAICSLSLLVSRFLCVLVRMELLLHDVRLRWVVFLWFFFGWSDSRRLPCCPFATEHDSRRRANFVFRERIRDAQMAESGLCKITLKCLPLTSFYSYLQPISGPGVPPNSLIPFCGCTYYFSPPQCNRASVPAPLCNASNPSLAPPFCEYCLLGLNPGFPSAENGCQNFGDCNLRNITSNAPPNFQTPVCECPTGWVPPVCGQTLFDLWGDNQTAYDGFESR
jgi:hypothetical protein